MRKLTILTIAGLIFTSLMFAKGVAAVTVEEISGIIAEYPDGYFTNANAGIKASFIKGLESIAANLSLFNTETDALFKAELDQEVHNGIEKLIAKTDGCVEGGNNPGADDWLAECQAQNEIYFKLNELLTSY